MFACYFHSTRIFGICLFLFAKYIIPYQKVGANNCIFFMNIASKTESEFVDFIKQRYQFMELDDLAKDYLSEIYENSKIVSIKNFFFRLAIIPTFAAIVLFIIILIF